MDRTIHPSTDTASPISHDHTTRVTVRRIVSEWARAEGEDRTNDDYDRIISTALGRVKRWP